MPAAPPILGSTGSTTLVLAIVLVALGVGMLMTTLWLVRATRTDTRALGPLEVMGDRRFRRRDAAARDAVLTAARPPGFQPPAPMVEVDDDPSVALAAPVVPVEDAPPLEVAAANADGDADGDAVEPDEPVTPVEPVESDEPMDATVPVHRVEQLEPAPEST